MNLIHYNEQNDKPDDAHQANVSKMSVRCRKDLRENQTESFRSSFPADYRFLTFPGMRPIMFCVFISYLSLLILPGMLIYITVSVGSAE